MAGVQLELPRLTAKQRKEQKTAEPSVKQFLKTTIFEPFVRGTIENLTTRFGPHQKVVHCLSSLIPQYFGKNITLFLLVY